MQVLHRAAFMSADSDRAAFERRPIVQGDGDKAVLLLHGLTGTPHDIAPFAEALYRQGYAVRGPLLAGHDDVPSLETSTWRQWYATADNAFDALRDGGRRRVVVLGFSAGSLLAIRLAALRPRDIEGLAALSVPLQFATWKRGAISTLAKLRTTPGLGRLVGVLAKEGPDVRSRRVARTSPSLRAFPFPALAELLELQEEVEDLLPLVRAPLLLLHGKHDHTAPVHLAGRVAQRVASPRVRKVILPRSFHILAHDLDAKQACDEVVNFVSDCLGPVG